MAYMEEQKTRMNKTSFDKLQTAMGFNYKPPGLLAHPAYGPPVIDCIMYDWFHIFLVNGIFQILTGFLLGELHSEGWKAEAIDRFANGFSWPARIRGGASKNLLHKRGASRDTLKCSASEALNFMVALRAYLTLFVLPTCTDALRRSCRAWLALVAVIEKLQAGASAPAELQRLIVEQLDPQMPPSSSSPATSYFAVSAQDLAVVDHESQRLVGRVGYHVRVGTTCFSHITFWKHVHGLMFRVTEDEVALAETRHIRDTCSFSLQGDSAIVCMPWKKCTACELAALHACISCCSGAYKLVFTPGC
eukprot:s4862_g10.t1